MIILPVLILVGITIYHVHSPSGFYLFRKWGLESAVISGWMMTDPDDIDDFDWPHSAMYNPQRVRIESTYLHSIYFSGIYFSRHYIDASPICFYNCSHILHFHQRNATSNTTTSTLTFHPRHSDQVYAHHPILRLALQFLFFICQYDLSRSEVRSGVADSA